MACRVQLSLPSPRMFGEGAGGELDAHSPRDADPASRTVPDRHTAGRIPRTSPFARPSDVFEPSASFTSFAGHLQLGSRAAFRVLHFSVQDELTLTRGLRGLTIRVARAVNRVLGRRGPSGATDTMRAP